MDLKLFLNIRIKKKLTVTRNATFYVSGKQIYLAYICYSILQVLTIYLSNQPAEVNDDYYLSPFTYRKNCGINLNNRCLS